MQKYAINDGFANTSVIFDGYSNFYTFYKFYNTPIILIHNVINSVQNFYIVEKTVLL